MTSGGCHKAVASEGNHSWSSGVLSIIGSSGTLMGSTCIGDPGAVTGWIGCSAGSAGGKTSVPKGGVGSGEKKN